MSDDTTVRDLLLIGVIGGVGMYAARMLLKPGSVPSGPIVVPSLPPIPIPDDDGGKETTIIMPSLPTPQLPTPQPVAPPTTIIMPQQPTPPQIIMPQIPSPDNNAQVPNLNITLPNGENYTPPLKPDTDPVKPDPIVPEDPEVPDPVKPEEPDPTPEPKPDLPPPVNVPEWKNDVGNWYAKSLNLSGANGGVLQHMAKWGAEKEKRMDANPDRTGKLWEAYYGLTSSPGAVKVGEFFKNLF